MGRHMNRNPQHPPQTTANVGGVGHSTDSQHAALAFPHVKQALVSHPQFFSSALGLREGTVSCALRSCLAAVLFFAKEDRIGTAAKPMQLCTVLGARTPASASCVCDIRSHPSKLRGKGSMKKLSKSYVVIGKRLFTQSNSHSFTVPPTCQFRDSILPFSPRFTQAQPT